jgi:hypothetical protein
LGRLLGGEGQGETMVLHLQVVVEAMEQKVVKVVEQETMKLMEQEPAGLVMHTRQPDLQLPPLPASSATFSFSRYLPFKVLKLILVKL